MGRELEAVEVEEIAHRESEELHAELPLALSTHPCHT